MSVSEFKAHCLEVINRVALSGSPVTLTKRGKPIAALIPPPKSDQQSLQPGKFKDRVSIVGDIVAPLDVEWEAQRDTP